MDSQKIKQTLDYLEEIIVVSNDPKARKIALKAALNLATSFADTFVVEGWNIPSDVYKAAILSMHQDKKIQAIKHLRDGIEGISLKDAKTLCEQISYVEKIPTRFGYGYDENNNWIDGE